MLKTLYAVKRSNKAVKIKRSDKIIYNNNNNNNKNDWQKDMIMSS